jgi:hypothetical protein
MSNRALPVRFATGYYYPQISQIETLLNLICEICEICG